MEAQPAAYANSNVIDAPEAATAEKTEQPEQENAAPVTGADTDDAEGDGFKEVAARSTKKSHTTRDAQAPRERDAPQSRSNFPPRERREDAVPAAAPKGARW